jgi:pimeloyl-ACP methyl ester carboxylesterase
MFFRENLIISKEEAKLRYSSPASHFIQWRGVEIHYTDEGQGPAMLMLHGLGGNFTNYDSLAAIMKQDYRVVRVDLPGFGLSDLPEQRDSIAELYFAFFDDLLDTLQMDSLYVIGNSMGGWMGWELAVNYPDKVKGLVLLGRAGYEMERVKDNIGRIEVLRNPFFMKLMERGFPLWVSERNASRMRSEWETFKQEEVVVNNGIMNRQGNFENMIFLATSNIQPDTTKIPQVACPTLVVWGKYDVIVPWEHTEKYKRDIPTSTVLVYDTCGHIPQMEYPKRLAKDIEQFISSNK